jgi:hypothetical protein
MAPQAPPPQVYISPAAMPAVYAPPPREDSVEPPRAQRSVAVPLLVGILVLALALAGYVVFQNRDRGGNQVADTSTTGAGDASAQPSHSPHVIPPYDRETVPWWTPDGWKEQRLGTIDQLWISRSESEGGKCDATKERMRVTTQPRGLTGCSLKGALDAPMSDGSIEAKVKVASGCAGMWLRTGDKGYMLGYCADGYVRIYKLAEKPPGPANTLQEWTFKATGDVYVAFLVKGNELVFYVNGKQFGPVSDGDIRSGKIDLGAFDLGEDTADVTFSEVRVVMPGDWQAGGSTPTKTRAPTPSASSSGWGSGSPSATPSGKKPTTSTPTG